MSVLPSNLSSMKEIVSMLRSNQLLAGDGSIVLVADFEQVPGVWIPGLRERISCLRVAQLHYPERMGLTVVTRPATLFWVL